MNIDLVNSEERFIENKKIICEMLKGKSRKYKYAVKMFLFASILRKLDGRIFIIRAYYKK